MFLDIIDPKEAYYIALFTQSDCTDCESYKKEFKNWELRD